MNILYLETNLPPYCGGIERVTWLVSNYLEQIGYHCFYGYKEEDFDDIDDAYKIKYNPYGTKEEILSVLDPFLKKNKIDIIVNQGFYYRDFCEAMVLLKEKYHVGIVSCVHYSINELFSRNPNLSFKIKDLICRIIFGHGMKARVLRPFYECSDRLVMLSKTFFDDVVRFLEMKNVDRLCAIPNPLSYNQVTTPILNERKKQVFICSRLTDPQKNITGALRIWKEIEKRGYEEWCLIIAGTGEDETMLRNYAQDLKLKRVKWLGRVKDPMPFYQQSPIFMMTSNWEGWGMTLTEAMQAGCVPIAFDSYSSLHDIVTNNQDGVIVPYPDEIAYSNALENLMNDKERLQRLSSQGVISSQRFSIEIIGKQWEKLFEQIKKENES